MSETIETFELETISDRKTGVLAIRDYDATLQTARQIVAEHPVPTIENDAQKKEAKAFRAILNKVIKAIDRRRIDTVADYTSDFEDACKGIKNVFSELEQGYKAEIERYEKSLEVASVETAPTTKFVATIKFTDPKLVKKLTDFCTKNGCDLSIK